MLLQPTEAGDLDGNHYATSGFKNWYLKAALTNELQLIIF